MGSYREDGREKVRRDPDRTGVPAPADRAGRWLLVALIALGLLPVGHSLAHGLSANGEAAVGFAIALMATWGLIADVRARRRERDERERYLRDPRRWS